MSWHDNAMIFQHIGITDFQKISKLTLREWQAIHKFSDGAFLTATKTIFYLVRKLTVFEPSAKS